MNLKNFEFVTTILVILNIIGFILNYQLNGSALLTGQVMSNDLLKVGGMTGHTDVISWFTSMFQHASIAHILLNMLALISLGPTIRYVYHSYGYILGYLGAGLGGSIMTAMFNPDVVTVGASGAICGLLGMVLVASLFSSKRNELMFGNIVASIGMVLVNTFLMPNISITGHIGGLTSGFVIGLIFIIIAKLFKFIQTGFNR